MNAQRNEIGVSVVHFSYALSNMFALLDILAVYEIDFHFQSITFVCFNSSCYTSLLY
jgi:hypothetical protein